MLIKKNIIIDPKINNFQVMMAWEKPYMEECVKYLKPSGDVLEIGFGMGYSATAINKNRINSYTVIEKDKGVIKNFNKWKLKQKTKKIKLIEGIWQYKLPFLNKKYDCIFFDDSPSSEYELKYYDKKRFTMFLKLILLKNVKYNSKLVSYASSKTKFSGYLTKHFKHYSYKYQITIPYYCKYTKGNYMYINKIIFKKLNNKN
jgi:predicted methyltransferase